MDKKAIQDFYPDSLNQCYGCGQLNEHGLRIRSFREGDESVCRFAPEPYHTAVVGYVYGGLIARAEEIKGRKVVVSAELLADSKVCATGKVVAVRLPDGGLGN